MRNFILIFTLLFVIATNSKAAEVNGKPSLLANTIKGNEFNLKDKAGKVVIVNFWAEWCSTCRQEILILDDLYHEYEAQGLEVIGVNIDHESRRRKVLEVASPLSYPNSMLHEVKESSFEKPNSIPLSFVIDRGGKLVARITVSEDMKLTRKNFKDVIKTFIGKGEL